MFLVDHWAQVEREFSISVREKANVREEASEERDQPTDYHQSSKFREVYHVRAAAAIGARIRAAGV